GPGWGKNCLRHDVIAGHVKERASLFPVEDPWMNLDRVGARGGPAPGEQNRIGVRQTRTGFILPDTCGIARLLPVDEEFDVTSFAALFSDRPYNRDGPAREGKLRW